MGLSRTLKSKLSLYEQRHNKVILQHDYVRAHVAKKVKNYLEMIKCEVPAQTPYSPDIVLSYYHLFRLMAHGLAEQQFHSCENAKKMGRFVVNLKRRRFSDVEFKC